MYLKYYKIKHEPFATTADPNYLFVGETHKRALERLLATVTKQRGITTIIGEPGLGKSTLLRTLLTRLEQSVNFAWIFNTTMQPNELLKYICRDFGFAPKSDNKSDLLIELYTFFIREYEKNCLPLIIIDEAQNLTLAALEEIRQLSNLETVNKKLVQIILCGQPQLDAKLDMPQMVQLKQRINCKAILSRLTCEETVAYIQHRLAVAGAENTSLFSHMALRKIYELSGGIPRLINQLCDDALHAGAHQKMAQVDTSIIRELVENGDVIQAPAAESKTFQPACQLQKNQVRRKKTVQKPGTAVNLNRPRIIEKYDFFEAIDLSELLSLV
ncbi:AAA family ATPase [candidate division KSB1 bacterium]|nr:AAA family ATPase [candidate division KSB1 bacterium]